MKKLRPSINIHVDIANPGQFFACCGLLELADRLWPGAEGWFDANSFNIACDGTLDNLLKEIVEAEIVQIDPANDRTSPMMLSEPFELILDWWCDSLSGGKELKVWAGSMHVVRIARAMQKALMKINEPQRLFDHMAVVYDPNQKGKKVEPYYFDSRRGSNARPLDIGFSPDTLKSFLKTSCYPAVEILCLVGLQRFRPSPTEQRRFFVYYAWSESLSPQIAHAVSNGMVLIGNPQGFRFENGFRTDQKKHKSFLPATKIGGHP